VDIDETIVADGASAARAITEPYSAEWWQERSTTELRDIIKRGFSLGPAYDGAVVETERRAREALRRIRDDNAVVEQRKARLRLALLAGVLAIIVTIGLADWLTS
jgi:hypothetical protein